MQGRQVGADAQDDRRTDLVSTLRARQKVSTAPTMTRRCCMLGRPVPFEVMSNIGGSLWRSMRATGRSAPLPTSGLIL